MTLTTVADGWELEVRPRKMRIVAFLSAGAIAAGAIFGGATAGFGSTGPRMTVADQVSIAGVGLIVATVILLLTRPRLRVGERGIAMRNLFLERQLAWPEVRGVSFPGQSPWARLELPADEYLPVMAIQVRDGETAATALEKFRELGRKYAHA